MITSLRLTDFKNFADATLWMGPFTVIVGTNASGKSNLRDAFRILHGIGRGYNLVDAVGGKYGDETFKNTSVVCRRADADTAVVRPVDSLPDADKLRQSQGLGRLHASGWMEDAIFFTEGTENEEPRWT